MARGIPRQVIEMLAEVPLFSACNQKELRRIAGFGTPVSVAEGKILTKEGDPGPQFFLILAGKAVCTIKRREVARFGPGEWFGEMSLLDGSPRTATVAAATPMEVLVLDAREFVSLIVASPTIARKLLSGLATRLRHADAALSN